MQRGQERIIRVQGALQEAGLDALVCTLPANVLLLSGYWPVVGTAVAAATRDGRIALMVPEDERDLAERGWATDVRTFQPGSLARLIMPAEAVREPLARLLRDLGVAGGRIAYEAGDAFEPSTYAAMYLFGAAGANILTTAAPSATLVSGAVPLSRLHAVMTTEEVGRVRLACAIAAGAFAEGARAIRPGRRESAVAAEYQTLLSTHALNREDVGRGGAFPYCMSGPNAALAGAAYARTRARELGVGDLVLVHCNSYIDGYWTDITRTYCLGEPDERQRAMYAAVFEARTAALAAIRPGARGSDVDRAARDVLTSQGFGRQFTHGLGHNVGFSAISTEFPPRLHPASGDRLEVGMTFNVEPAIYIEGYGGMRHCDVVTLGAGGAEVLTAFQDTREQLILPDQAAPALPEGTTDA
jgi:Xaa-Pro aminopeptidase